MSTRRESHPARLLLCLAALAGCGSEPTTTSASASTQRPLTASSGSAKPGPAPSASAAASVPASASAASPASASASAAASAPSASSSAPRADEACRELAAALCAQHASCDHGYRLKWTYSDADTCKSAVAAGCVDLLQAPDVGAGPAEVAECTQAVAKASCDEVAGLRSWRLPACLFKGKRPADAGCSVDSQCQSGVCQRASDTEACGKCLPTFAPGDACESNRASDCRPRLACRDKKCAQPVATGGACTKRVECEFGSNCENGKCAPQPKEGSACDTDNDSDTPRFCHFAYGCVGKKCVPRALAAVGEKCAPGQGPFCMRGECDLKTRLCKPLAQVGEKCDAATTCAEPLDCLGGTCGMAGKTDCR